MVVKAEASAKIILFGEHAVVYDKPGIAIPVKKVRARVEVRPSDKLRVEDRGYGGEYQFEQDYPLMQTIKLMQKECGKQDPMYISINSEIPTESGLGSGAGLAVAMIRAIAKHYGKKLDTKRVNELAYEIEKIHHGTPSGIDNTTIAYEKPIFFKKSQELETFDATGFSFVIANTGIPSKTRETVAGVRERWEANKTKYNRIFDKIENITNNAKQALSMGDETKVGKLMTENHLLLKKMGVSCKALDTLVEKAIEEGAIGAKMSGGGGGGNIIALVHKTDAERIAKALGNAIITEL